MLQYPPQLEGETITLLIDIVRHGQIVERSAEFGLAAWNVQGVLQGLLLGTPPQPIGLLAPRPVLGDIEIKKLRELQAILEDPEQISIVGYDIVDEADLSPALLAAILELIKLILSFWK